jgi:hypothetical protein
MVQSVLRLATGWTVRGSTPGGGKAFSLRQNATRLTLQPTKPPPMGMGVKRPRHGADHPSHLAQKFGNGGAIQGC